MSKKRSSPDAAEQFGSNKHRAKRRKAKVHADARRLATSMFTTFMDLGPCNGLVGATMPVAGVTRTSRIFATPCEYGGNDPILGRFIGAAPIIVKNLCPLDGAVDIELDVQWDSPIGVRVDLLIDP